MFYAIDFGTSNTVITRWNAATDSAETVRLPGLSAQIADNPPLIPSLLYVKSARSPEVFAGQEVRDHGLDIDRDPRFFRRFKRGIGAKIQGFLPELDEKTVRFEDAGQWFLDTVIDRLKTETTPPESIVLTVPVDSFETYRNWLSDVCQGWRVEQIRLIDEPTAAALGYGATGDNLVLVVDFGGGTIDLSLVRLNLADAGKNQGFILKWGEKLLGNNSAQKTKLARVLAKAGTNLGGSDIDDWIVEHFVRTAGLAKTSLTTRLAERLKIQLSSRVAAEEVYFNDETFESYELALNRQQLEEILRERDFFQQLDSLMTRVLQQGRRNGIEIDDIDAVLLVGGTVQIPAVRDWVKGYFDESKIRQDRPFEAIALGALQLARGYEVKDFLYHGYGIRYWNKRKNAHGWHPIIKSGQPYPMTEPVELVLGASVENQPSIELVIGELGAESGGLEVYFDGDRLITRSIADADESVRPLNDRDGARSIAKLDPPGFPGSDRIKVQFWVDEQRFLRINVEDLLNNESLLNNQIVTKLS
ncbi:Hsp70 family protein [Pannus brasiliensis CCIBt3594]|uniref:Hsp70 family protein n=1 Tax=Pannus brasiliensis CCIBt3594 TaxID=1427578 RepID=A0AAW9R0F6_9CHRO